MEFRWALYGLCRQWRRGRGRKGAIANDPPLNFSLSETFFLSENFRRKIRNFGLKSLILGEFWGKVYPFALCPLSENCNFFAPTIAISWTPRGSGRKRGRPTKTWRSTFKEDLVDRGVDWNSVRAVATDRHRWLAAHCPDKDWRI